jgi:hypothetical protein
LQEKTGNPGVTNTATEILIKIPLSKTMEGTMKKLFNNKCFDLWAETLRALHTANDHLTKICNSM